ncbi:MAG: SAM-dependent methyltransferase [Chloroflexi bacterium]|nr:SAM-dependent methyltransferase [Chloroflexota bacterium]
MEIDTTKPNAGRIYDYYLGGSHNFEVDRQAAEQLLKLMPSTKPGARLNRWFLYDAVERLAQQGFDAYLDLASGLPTQGYIHEIVPQAHVLYTDHDPVTVAYGQQIIGDKPNVRYIQANIMYPETILQAAETHFGGQRRIAICFVGSTYFVDKPTLRSIMEQLFAWCAPGSQMALSLLAGDVQAFTRSQYAAIYARMNATIYPLELPEVAEILGPWRIAEPGLLTLGEWHQLGEWRGEPGEEDADQPLDFYGVLVTKE